MGFGFGPGADMQKAYNSNKSKLKKNKSLKDINKGFHENSNQPMKFTQMNEDEYQQWKENLEKQFERDRRRKIIVGVFVIIICFLVFMSIMV